MVAPTAAASGRLIADLPPNGAAMSWTDERVETLKHMWSEGKSASQIAKELGGVTRNAVIGKVHRLGLSNRVGGVDRPEDEAALAAFAEDPAPEPLPEPSAEAQPAPARAPAKDPAPAVRSKPTGQPMPPQPSGSEISAEALANLAEVAKKARRLTLMQLTERTCKWPVGDPATDDFWFCGLPTVPGKPYCETHVAVAFQPMSARRDRRAGGR
jgi:GcrA cell cycle regulator